MQLLTLVLPGGRDRMGAVVLDDVASSHFYFYLYVGETRDEGQRLCGLLCVFWFVSIAPEYCCLEVCIPEGKVGIFPCMERAVWLISTTRVSTSFLAPSQHAQIHLFNNPFTL